MGALVGIKSAFYYIVTFFKRWADEFVQSTEDAFLCFIEGYVRNHLGTCMKNYKALTIPTSCVSITVFRFIYSTALESTTGSITYSRQQLSAPTHYTIGRL